MSWPQLTDQLSAVLPQTARQLLQQAAQIATEQGVKLYLVGGPVRDLLLRRPLTDLDLVVEGDAWPVADVFAARLHGEVTRHAAFRTAVVQLSVHSASYAIDFVTARREHYPRPAVLPEITPSHMGDDLYRRDFTINAVALNLTPQGLGPLLDPYGGIADLAARVVRVLHERSFFDDPTRILRGARFAARLGFAVEEHSLQLIHEALSAQMIAATSPQRILNELWLMLDEPRPEEMLKLLESWSALPQLELSWCDNWAAYFPKASALCLLDPVRREVAFGLLVWAMDTRQRERFGARYNLPAPARKLLQELPTALPNELEQPELDAQTLDRLLARYSTTTLRTLEVVAPTVAAANIARYHDEIRQLSPLLTGDDLRAHGLAPGPRFRQILDEARAAQLKGEISTRDQALHWLAAHV